MQELEGGRPGAIFRDGDRVVRPANAWTPTVQRFLAHLHRHGIISVPAPLGFDGPDREVVGFVPGEVCNSVAEEAARGEAVLLSAARLLRAFHTASAGFLEDDPGPRRWMLPTVEPAELVCHGDFAPYNVTISGGVASGIIDFDTAHPGPRIRDLAYAVYRWAPLSRPDHDGVVFGTSEQVRRARGFCRAYGADEGEIARLPAVIGARLRDMIEHMRRAAAAGDRARAADLAAGHDAFYLRDIDYVNGLDLGT